MSALGVGRMNHSVLLGRVGGGVGVGRIRASVEVLGCQLRYRRLGGCAGAELGYHLYARYNGDSGVNSFDKMQKYSSSEQ